MSAEVEIYLQRRKREEREEGKKEGREESLYSSTDFFFFFFSPSLPYLSVESKKNDKCDVSVSSNANFTSKRNKKI